jgi:hypothetical protein
MPAYEIRYLDSHGIVAHHFSATCENDTKAKVIAHAMKSPSDAGLEVWLCNVLIYRRAAIVLRQRPACGMQPISAGAAL